MVDTPPQLQAIWKRLDALVLAILVLSRIRIDTLAEAAVLPLRQNDIARHPWLGRLLPDAAETLLAQQQLVDPIGLVLIVGALGSLLIYLGVNEFVRSERADYRASLTLVWLILALTIFAPSLKMILLRQGSGPASYSHDGGVIQTEAAIEYVLQGRNPYVEDYLQTAMVEWGINEFRTALYHYPYLPWTFLFSAPCRLMADAVLGWYDQRLVYLLLFARTLVLVAGLTESFKGKLLLVMLIGLNPIMGSDLIYGQNDSFVLAWIVLSVWLWKRGQGPQAGRAWVWLSAAAFGLACASKPTAWFFAPYYLVLLAGEPVTAGRRRLGDWLLAAWRQAWPALLMAGLIIVPYLVWNPGAMFDDVWRWSNGTSDTAYQIWGWGASNLVLVLGWVESRFDYWPFWLPELLVCLPLGIVLLWRQARDNSLGRAIWGAGLWLLAFLFVSRFLNENYLGYVAAFLVMGALATGESHRARQAYLSTRLGEQEPASLA